MAEFSVNKATGSSHRHLLLPELEPQEPPSLSPLSTLKPFRRGPMYSAYTELRDWKIRMKKARLNSTSPVPLPINRSSFSCSSDSSMAFRKENRKPAGSAGPGFDSCKTPPPPVVPKLELRRAGSVSAGRVDEKKKGSGGGLIDVRRSFSGFNQLKELYKASASPVGGDGRRVRGGSKTIARKSFTGIELPRPLKARGLLG